MHALFVTRGAAAGVLVDYLQEFEGGAGEAYVNGVGGIRVEVDAESTGGLGEAG